MDLEQLRRNMLAEAAKLGFDLTKPGELERLSKAAAAEAAQREAEEEAEWVEAQLPPTTGGGNG